MLLFFIFLLFAFLSFGDKVKSYNIKIIIYLFLGFISIVLCFKASDFPAYKDFYQNVESITNVLSGDNYFFYAKNIYDFEIGYKLFNSFLKIFNNNILFFYIVYNGLILFLIFKYFEGKSSNFFKLLLPFFVFVCITIQACIVRQMIAITIFYFSIPYIYKKEFLKYFVLCLLAFCFHNSAVILPFLYFIVNREYSTKLLLSVLGIGLLIFLGVIPFHPVNAVEWINKFIPFSSVHDRITFYTFWQKFLAAPQKFTRGIFENVGMFLLLIYIRYYLKKRNLYDSFTNICINLSLLFIVLYIYLFDISSFLYRLNYYLVIFKFFVIVKFIENIDLKSHRIIANSLLIVYCGLLLVVRINQGF